MRISDWSSDVCSSDLAVQRVAVPIGGEGVDPGDAELAKRGGSQFADRPRARESEPGVKLIDIVDADVAHRIGARAAPGDARSGIDIDRAMHRFVDRQSTRLNSSH